MFGITIDFVWSILGHWEDIGIFEPRGEDSVYFRYLGL
jgi:hypothetical protein